MNQLDVPQSSSRVRECVVCGDSPAKVHYGVLACFGCKGFFRRAVKDGRNKYVCRYEKNCVVNKFERNSCRYCRFRKCLRVGMNPDAVRPDRDQSTGGVLRGAKIHRTLVRRKSQLVRTASAAAAAVTGDGEDWTKYLSPQYRTLILDLVRLEADGQSAAECSYDSVAHFSLKSLISDRSLARRARLSARPSLSMSPPSTALSAIWRIVAVVDFVEGCLHSTIPDAAVSLEDKASLVQHAFFPLTLFGVAASVSATASPPEPHTIQQLIEECGQSTSLLSFSRQLISQLVGPLAHIQPTEAEYVLIKAVIAMDPNVAGLCSTSAVAIRSAREQLMELLLKTIKKSRSREERTTAPASHFGNLLMIAPILQRFSCDLLPHYSQLFPRPSLERPFLAIKTDLFSPETDGLEPSPGDDRSDAELPLIQQRESEPLAVSCAQMLFYNPPPLPPAVPSMPPPFMQQPVFCAPAPSAFQMRRPSTLERPTSFSSKLPLQMTRSIEEMLRPPVGGEEDALNRPLPADWADGSNIATPVLNRDVVAQFFPEMNSIQGQNINPINQYNEFPKFE